MLDKIKSGLAYLCCACLGTFHFIFMAFSYATGYAMLGGEEGRSPLFNGYGAMKLGLSEELASFYEAMEIITDNAGYDGLRVFGAVLQILLLLVALGLMALGVIGILKVFGVARFLPDKLGSMKTTLLAKIALLGYAGLTLILFIILWVWGLMNSYEDSVYGTYFEISISVGAGLWLALLFGALVASAAWLLPMFVPALKENAGPRMNYVCAQCGKKAGANEKFCTVCGGTIVCEVVKQYEYVCSGCGKKAKKTDKFCNVCGNAIVAVEIKPMEYVCSNCGRPQSKNDRFCTTCGGAVIAREVMPAPTAAPMAAPAAYACPVCGKPVTVGQKFCTGCGSIL